MPLPPSRLALRAACLPAAAAAIFGIWYSARLAVADSLYRADTPDSLARAVRIEPGSAAYHQLYAEHLESAGMNPDRELETAALLSPLESRYWIDLGVQAEARSDFSSAERYYLKAASVDRTFAPRWALMNFYFRRQNEPAFWRWTREALPMAYGDVSPVFRLCWMMTNDAERIERILPASDFLRKQYLTFLLESGRLEAAAPVAREVAVRAVPEDVGFLLEYCNQSMMKNTLSAVEVWNTLALRELLPFRPLDPAAGAIVTNGEFRTPPSEQGFDWHIARTDGASLTLDSAGLNVALSGDQPVAMVLLTEWLPVVPGQPYRIECRYSGNADGSQSRDGNSGLSWEVVNPVTNAPLARSAQLRESARNADEHLDFTVNGMTAVKLSLVYERTPGTVRHEERFTIHGVSSRMP